jgi:hypothetical protein
MSAIVFVGREDYLSALLIADTIIIKGGER